MNTKLVILAGGRGTRLNEKTKDIPKPHLVSETQSQLFGI